MRLEEWSVVWEGIAAIGTVGAVGWAVFTTLTERRKRTDAERALTEEKAASRVAKHREQADHVAVWFEVQHMPVIASGGGAVSFMHGSALVGNYSSAPIFNIIVSGEAVLAGKTFGLGDDTVVPPGPDPWTTNLGDAAEYGGELRLWVEFTDVAGVRWRRWSSGELEEIDPL